MRKHRFRHFILFLSAVTLFFSCQFMKNHVQHGGLGSMAKVNRAERLYKRQEYEKAISLCNEVINNGAREEVLRKAKLQLARIYVETRQFEKTISLYDELLYKPGKDVLVTDVTNYIDLLKRTGRVVRAKEIAAVYANNYKNNARFTNLQESLVDYYSFFNRDSLQNVRVDSLRLNLPGYQYGLALYQENVVFLSNDFKKKEAQSFYTNSKLYQISEDGIEPFSSSLRGVLQVGPASFYDNGKKVIYTSNRYADIKNEKNSYINYNNGTQLLSANYQADHDNWTKPVPVKLGKHGGSSSFLHPSVVPSGKRLYFASDMPGGQGGTDIYYADWDKEAKRWKEPVNMGPEVNTNGNELYPFVIGDKLFFSSNGLPGFGGLDIFMINVKKREEGVAHLPYPVNTQFDDLNPVLDESRLLLYFTSDRSGAHDNDHIYVLNLKKNPLKQLDLPYPGKPVKDEDKVPYTMHQADGRLQKTFVGDNRYDTMLLEQKKQQLVKEPVATVAVTVSDDRKTTDYANETPDSHPEMIPWQNNMPQYATTTVMAGVNRQAAEEYNATASAGIVARQLDSISKAAAMHLRVPGVIYYDLNSYIPQEQERYKLDSVYKVWKSNPHRMIIVSGHTDIIGAERYNLALSKNRAVYIQECLLQKGVDADKIRINYFGSTRPVWVAKQFSLYTDRDMFIQQQGVNRRCEINIQ
ncbi:OmpA family protein [Chitinophaga nivalis]|uniref:OmpA family protein n=1 Tax=Chitinophaga nivalis TaxID=2991709 RepID=A0ABT3IS62_9BACT|nr:OmpA family protein [Chitinophaga nivalis]MCW3463761.1 OmpA family protein [Chitinophaga nivalis]MCW3486549.1 OmpA family protein [Chitinophaga nivalis]